MPAAQPLPAVSQLTPPDAERLQAALRSEDESRCLAALAELRGHDKAVVYNLIKGGDLGERESAKIRLEYIKLLCEHVFNDPNDIYTSYLGISDADAGIRRYTLNRLDYWANMIVMLLQNPGMKSQAWLEYMDIARNFFKKGYCLLYSVACHDPDAGIARDAYLLHRFINKNILVENDDNLYSIFKFTDFAHPESLMPSLEDRVEAIKALPPEDFDRRLEAAALLTADGRTIIAAELAPALNARIRAMPHETLDQKKEIGRWVNDQLEPLGLAVKCPKTDLPGKLWGIKGSYRPGKDGSFCIEVRKNGKNVKTAQFDTLPELTLTDATPLHDPGKPWQEAVGPKSNRTGQRR